MKSKSLSPKARYLRRTRRTLLAAAVTAGLVLTSLTLPGTPAASAAPTLDPASVEPLATAQDQLVLRYDEPANDWQSRSLPIGNGAMGASVFGGVGQDSIQMNEKTLWSGGPGAPGGYDYGNHDARAGLKAVQDQIAANGYAENGWAISQLGRPKQGYGSYLAFGKLELTVPGTDGYTAYERSLDLDHAVAKTTYTVGGITYTREYLASYPGNVIAVRITATNTDGSPATGAVDLTVGYTDQLDSDASQVSTTAVDDTLTYAGTLTNGLRFDARTQVVADGGQVTNNASTINVADANSVTLYWSGATDYSDSYADGYRNGVDPATVTAPRVQAAATAGWDAVRAAHEADYSALFSRMKLDLNADAVTGTTDDALSAYQGSTDSGRALETLYTQYGRYLLIASSRDNSPLPANLQGVWAQPSPPWSADYHVNINLQMNYWPAYATGLGELAQPYERYVSSMVPAGQASAQQLFGYDAAASGWVVFNETTPYGYTGVFDWPTASWFPEAAAWVANTYWQNYQYTGDVAHLRDKGYPVLKGASQFWLNMLVDAGDGTLVVSPSYSPEHGKYSAGAAMSQQIVTELLSTTLEAAKVTGETDTAFVQQATDALAKLQPGLRVGSHGQLQEWIQDWDYTAGWGGDEPNHRHTSQLYALYPGTAIDPLTKPDTQAYADAARQTLKDRGDGGTGWSKAWKINFWASLADGDHSHLMLEQILKQSTYANLWDAHPPFQIDGNFGATAGVAQMLVQSKNGVTRLLPALPSAWGSGSVDGLRAHNGLTVGATWQDGSATQLRLQAAADGTHLLDADLLDGMSAVVDTTADAVVKPTKDAATGAWSLSMTGGHTYVVVPTGTVKAQADKTSMDWGTSTTVTVTVDGAVAPGSTLALTTPNGWTVAEGTQTVNAAGTYAFNVTAPTGTAGPATLEAVLTSGESRTTSRVAITVTDPTVIPQSQMSIKETSSQETASENGAAANLLDGDPSTYWHSDWSTSNPQPPHHVVVNLGKVEQVATLTWTPRNNTDNGLIKDYEVWAAADDSCTQFTKVTSGSWPQSRDAKTLELGGVSAHCIKLVSTSQAWYGNWATGSELTMTRVVPVAPATPTPTATSTTNAPGTAEPSSPATEPAQPTVGPSATATAPGTPEASPSQTPLSPKPSETPLGTAAPTATATASATGTQPAPVGTPPAYVAAAVAKGGLAITGDWDGDGTVTYAVRVGTRIVFYNENRSDAPVHASISIGRSTDKLLVGDWNGDGKDTIALWRGTTVLTQNRLTSTATTKTPVAGLNSSITNLVVQPGQAPGEPDTIVVG